MQRITSWPEFLASASPFLGAARPLDAMANAGITLDGEVGKAFQSAKPQFTISPQALDGLVKKFGAPPRMTMRMGRKQARAVPLLRPGGYQITASADIDVLNQVLAALWSVDQIPQQLSEDQTDGLISLNDLRPLCSGIPGDAVRLQGMILPAPPVVSQGSTMTNIHAELSLRLAVKGRTDSGLICKVQVEMPLGFDVSNTTIQFAMGSIANAEVVGLDIDKSSTIVPVSDAAKATLATKLEAAVRNLSLFSNVVSIDSGFLSMPIHQLDGVSLQRPGASFVVLGGNIEFNNNADASGLSKETLPLSPDNVHLSVDQSFANTALATGIASGDIAKSINAQLPQGSPQLKVNSGSVELAAGQAVVSLDSTLVGACIGGKDLGLTLTVTGNVGVSNGKLSVLSPTVNIDLDDVDAVICALSGIVAGLGIVVTTLVVAGTAFANPAVGTQSLPGVPTTLVPGSEVDFQLNFVAATAENGTLLAEGKATLIADTVRSFVYLKIVTGAVAQLVQPVVGAKVALFELDNPQPKGDDVKFTGKPRPGHKLTFTPSQDQALGTQTTDANGFVQFAVIPNTVGGILTETETVEDTRTGKLVTKTTGQQIIGEGKPDFGVTITGKDGIVLATRRLIALNVGDRHVGSFARPFVVNVGQLVVTAGNA